MTAAAIPAQPSIWDARRNTSMVHAVPPNALPDALAALAALRRTDPTLVAWIEAGHPNLTEHEHVARFGESYTATRSRKASAQP